MKLHPAWSLATGVMVGLVVLTAVAPRIRERKALATVHELGLPLTYAELRRPIPPAENAVPDIEVAFREWNPSIQRDAANYKVLSVNAAVLAGTATPEQRRLAVEWIERTAPALSLWRAATLKPKVDYRDPFDRDFAWSYELLQERYAGQTLVLAAAMGHAPKGNLLAAARLAGLLRGEVGFTPQLKGAVLAEDCLKLAPRLGLTREVLVALGPSPDFRDALRTGLPRLLRVLEEARESERKEPTSLLAQLTRLNLFGGNPRVRAMAGWSGLWRALPNDPRDFEGAAQVAERRLPELDGLPGTMYPGIPHLSVETRETVAGLRAMGRSAALRAKLEGYP